MTDIAKALAFAEECLQWPDACVSQNFIQSLEVDVLLDIHSHDDIQLWLEIFLGKRFFIQINRGTSSLFKWSVIVGLQNRVEGPKGVFDHGHGAGDDMFDAIFDACVAAARLYPSVD
jgi:hypothetical protein